MKLNVNNKFVIDKNVRVEIDRMGQDKKLSMVAGLSNFKLIQVNKLPTPDQNFFRVTFVG
jgi:hypothetical protein